MVQQTNRIKPHQGHGPVVTGFHQMEDIKRDTGVEVGANSIKSKNRR